MFTSLLSGAAVCCLALDGWFFDQRTVEIRDGLRQVEVDGMHSQLWTYMKVSWNGGIPKSFILMGFSIINQPFSDSWDTPNKNHPCHFRIFHEMNHPFQENLTWVTGLWRWALTSQRYAISIHGISWHVFFKHLICVCFVYIYIYTLYIYTLYIIYIHIIHYIYTLYIYTLYIYIHYTYTLYIYTHYICTLYIYIHIIYIYILYYM